MKDSGIVVIKENLDFGEAIKFLGGDVVIANDNWGGQMWLTDKPRPYKPSTDVSSIVDVAIDGSRTPVVHKDNSKPPMTVMTINISLCNGVIEKGYIASYDDLVNSTWSAYRLGSHQARNKDEIQT